MRLLFVKLKHIGDSLLMTPTLVAARRAYPAAQIWVVVRKGCEEILSGCMAIDRILTAAAPEPEKRTKLNWWSDWRLIQILRRQKLDYAFELSDGDRGRWLVALAGARYRCANDVSQSFPPIWRPAFNRLSHFNWLAGHRVEKDFHTVNNCVPLGSKIPRLAFESTRTAAWPPAEDLDDFVLLHPGTRWTRKRWPIEKWQALGQELATQFSRIVVSAGPDPDEIQIANQIQAAIGSQAISTAGTLSWAQLAGLLWRAKLFVGVDTAAMHLAAACQCPSIVIFGPSVEAAWRPWQVKHRIVGPSESDREKLPEEQWIQSVKTDAVMAACRELQSECVSRQTETASENL